MDKSSKSNKPRVDLSRFGLDSNNSCTTSEANVPRTESKHNNYQQAEYNELFTHEENGEPWWKTQFFVSEPVLFGMWDGVFTSCLINIFGVIVFLRSGWVVGEAGILNAFLIVLSTVGIALISVLSAIGVCERCRVESGGVYFLLAHVLGSRSAAAIGLLYVFGQAVGCSLNLLGFGESLAGLFEFSSHKWTEKLFAGAAVFLLWIINFVGVKWVIKLQFLLLLILLFAGLNFIVGSFIHVDYTNGFEGWVSDNFVMNLLPNYTDNYNWFTIFAVFFPSVTGVMAGINMSGDLSQPSQDIPNGTLIALAVGSGLYLIFVLFLGSTCTRRTLLSDFTIAAKVSYFRVLLLTGVYVSSLSSCLGAMYGTPRVLQSIANEKVIPLINVLGQGKGPNKIPVVAMIVIAITIIVFTLIGDINTLAPIVTMPFLLTYAALDYAYFVLAQTFDIQHQREQRFKKSVQESRKYQTSPSTHEENEDLDSLFPERNTLYVQNDVAEGTQNLTVHSKTANWYSRLCNRWLSLCGVALNVIIMCIVNSTYAIATLITVFIIWYYIGLTNPAVKPGAANEFNIVRFIRRTILKVLRKRPYEYEEIVVTPIHPLSNTESFQLTEENEDYAGRLRFHQTASVQPLLGKKLDSSKTFHILE